MIYSEPPEFWSIFSPPKKPILSHSRPFPCAVYAPAKEGRSHCRGDRFGRRAPHQEVSSRQFLDEETGGSSGGSPQGLI